MPKEKKKEIKRSFINMQTPEMSSNKILCSSLGGTSKTMGTKESCVRLYATNQSALLFPSRKVWFI